MSYAAEPARRKKKEKKGNKKEANEEKKKEKKKEEEEKLLPASGDGQLAKKAIGLEENILEKEETKKNGGCPNFLDRRPKPKQAANR